MTEWGFYGRRRERAELAQVLGRGRWFFLQISGRRRIGKTRLVQELLQPERRERVLYIQIPDSDPAGVVSTARDFMENFGVSAPLPHDLRSLAVRIGQLCAEGWIVSLDEFQYFSRKALYPFTSELQSEVDRLAATPEAKGGLIVLGSLHTEMQALLEDRSAPLYQRLTDTISLGHLDIASLLELLEAHADTTPERLLFLWNLFEGVPKFYRDCFEQGDPLHQGMGADQESRQHGLARTAPSPVIGVGASGQEGGFAGDGTVRIKMGRQQVIHGLDRLAGEGDFGIDNRIDQHGTAVEPAAELLLAPRLPEGISCDHIEDHIGIHEHHQGCSSPRLRDSSSSVLRRVRRRARRSRCRPSLPGELSAGSFSISTRPSSTRKRTWVWGNRPHCSRISWGMVTWPLLVIRITRRAHNSKNLTDSSGGRHARRLSGP